ncbi:unnamed protein product [Blepharisma stoltei]|uniref:Uncharacterized protein n=1 Tax=Blepharisma stoltei TaxID=1481888 RepID=A0AAU9JXA8_9CILI|nr:unnamed protein product [Blepharisma stoltei]
MVSIEISADQESKLHSILDKGLEVFNLKSELFSPSKSVSNTITSNQSLSISEATFKNELEKLQEKIISLEQKLKPTKSIQNTPRFQKSLKKSKSKVEFEDPYDFHYKKPKTPKKSKKPKKSFHRIFNELTEELNYEIESNEKLRKSNLKLKNEIISCKNLKPRLRTLREDFELLTQSYERSEEIRKKQKAIIEDLKQQLPSISPPISEYSKTSPIIKQKQGRISKLTIKQ